MNQKKQSKQYPQMKDITAQLVDLRKQRGITQAELSERIGMTERYVAAWECGQKNPRLFNLFCWLEALNAKLRVVANDNLNTES